MVDDPFDSATSSQRGKPSEAAPRRSSASGMAGFGLPKEKNWRTRSLDYLRVWIPQLLTEEHSARLVQYWARESRQGAAWRIALPRQCWQCAAKDSLKSEMLNVDVRGFTAPQAILGGGAFTALCLVMLAIALSWWNGILLAIVVLAACAAVFWLKSWKDRVQVGISTCQVHAKELQYPDLVLYDNDLYVFTPTVQLAKAARDELSASRRLGKGPVAVDAPPPSSRRARAESTESTPEFSRPAREALPPLKLDGDDPNDASTLPTEAKGTASRSSRRGSEDAPPPLPSASRPARPELPPIKLDGD